MKETEDSEPISCQPYLQIQGRKIWQKVKNCRVKGENPFTFTDWMRLESTASGGNPITSCQLLGMNEIIELK